MKKDVVPRVSPPYKEDVKAKSLKSLLDRVAPNLYRHRESKTYFAGAKFGGKDWTRFHSLETTDRKLAERKLAKWFEIIGQVDRDAAKATLAEIIEQFRRERAGNKKSTRDGEEMVFQQMKTAAYEDGRTVFDFTARFDRIKPADLIAFMALMAMRMVNGHPISPRTYNYHAFVLGQLCKIAHRDQVTGENIYKVAAIKWKRVPRRMPKLPTLEEFEAILTAIRTNRLTDDGKANAKSLAAGDVVEFMGRAGLGQAETWNLRWRDVDFEKGEMQILRQKTQTFFTVPIYPRLRPLLERLRAEADGAPVPEARVFKIKDPKRAILGAISRLHKKGVDLSHFSPRNFRQMAIKTMLRAGVDVQLISEWQAHRDGGKLIMDTYSQGTDSSDADYRRAQLAKIA